MSRMLLFWMSMSSMTASAEAIVERARMRL
jgi:hypothetical protein